ncbi:MAG: hypothetical protein ABI886_10550 [Betaproteobacteria bacterium]
MAADPPRVVHGSADAYAADGVALAWGVLRGASEAATVVVVRIVADPAAFAFLSVVGRDPFTAREQPLLARAPVAGSVELRVPRAHFADFPRTELRFDGPAAAPGASATALVVYYAGVPDTTPEFIAADKLDAYLADRLARVRATAGGPPR